MDHTNALIVFVILLTLTAALLVRPLVRRQSHVAGVDLPDKSHVPPEEVDLFVTVAIHDTCPDCGGKGFLGGPEGGMSQNIFCRNIECRSGFNLTPFSATQGLCERIGEGDIDRYPAADKAAYRAKLAPEEHEKEQPGSV